MSKIICDVCGTSFPDTATQCPICGCVRTADSKAVSGRDQSKGSGDSYTYVKGGRFSKSNVRKRNRASGVVSVNVVNDSRRSRQQESSGNRALVITAVVLLLAIVAVVLFITFRFFLPNFNTQTEPTTLPSTTPSTEATVPCEEAQLDATTIKLEEVGATFTVTATMTPENTTDAFEFVIADSTVATVEADESSAVVTAVAPGQTTLIFKCGDVKVTCLVECTFEDPNAQTSDPTAVSIPEGAELELNRKDMTMFSVGETWDLYSGEIPEEAITWTSENPNVATVENGVVKAVGAGMTTIHAKCNDMEVSCIVRCDFSSGDVGVPGSGGGITEDG